MRTDFTREELVYLARLKDYPFQECIAIPGEPYWFEGPIPNIYAHIPSLDRGTLYMRYNESVMMLTKEEVESDDYLLIVVNWLHSLRVEIRL